MNINMSMGKKVLLAVLLIASHLLFTSCNKTPEQPSMINDQVGVLSSDESSSLESLVHTYADTVGPQICVYITETTGKMTIEEFSLDYAERLGIGRAGIHDGLLITIALEDRTARIEVGYGLEKIIGDDVAGLLLRDELFPALRDEAYYNGLLQTLESVILRIDENRDLIGDLEGILVSEMQ